MSHKIRYKLSNEEFEAVLRFRDAVNAAPEQPALSVEQLAKQALFYSINDAFRIAHEKMAAAQQQQLATQQQEQEIANGETSSGDTSGAVGQASGSQGSDSDVLAQEEGNTAES